MRRKPKRRSKVSCTSSKILRGYLSIVAQRVPLRDRKTLSESLFSLKMRLSSTQPKSREWALDTTKNRLIQVSLRTPRASTRILTLKMLLMNSSRKVTTATTMMKTAKIRTTTMIIKATRRKTSSPTCTLATVGSTTKLSLAKRSTS